MSSRGEQITHFGPAWQGMYPDIQCVEMEFLGDMECTAPAVFSNRVMRGDRCPEESDADANGELTVEMSAELGGRFAHVHWDSFAARLCWAFYPQGGV